MPTYRGHRGNLLQHWVLAELIALLDRDDRATRLTFIDAHAMSPCALRCERPSQSSIDFDVVSSRLPGQGSTYEQAWLSLKAGRCEYPSSSALVQHLWGGQLELILGT